eukprot:TRINITY_DN186_c0_g1_i14.p1 TRINITY_DN186_c0_g1~~TRINITY_DN186_c0_g1_i14.p1  ORF type:complete len:120 (-),score=4.45 TRINITY_DN186_c0_g1_i14:163-522(-)
MAFDSDMIASAGQLHTPTLVWSLLPEWLCPCPEPTCVTPTLRRPDHCGVTVLACIRCLSEATTTSPRETNTNGRAQLQPGLTGMVLPVSVFLQFPAPQCGCRTWSNDPPHAGRHKSSDE